jgi:Spy/CpxP family protein refolding chaperone
MSLTKKFLGIGVICLGLASGAMAAPDAVDSQAAGRGPEAVGRNDWGLGQMKMRLERMTKELGLTKEQQDKLKPILEDEFGKLQELQGNDTLNRDERRARLQELNESTYGRIRPILTPEQQKKHDAAKQIIRERRSQQRATKPGMGPFSGPTLSDPDRRVAHMAIDLKLSEEQQAKIRPIVAEEFAQLEKLHGNDAINRAERRTRLQALNQATYEKIKPILTPEQLVQYEKIDKKIKDRRSLKKGPKPATPAEKQ